MQPGIRVSNISSEDDDGDVKSRSDPIESGKIVGVGVGVGVGMNIGIIGIRVKEGGGDFSREPVRCHRRRKQG